MNPAARANLIAAMPETMPAFLDELDSRVDAGDPDFRVVRDVVLELIGSEPNCTPHERRVALSEWFNFPPGIVLFTKNSLRRYFGWDDETPGTTRVLQ